MSSLSGMTGTHMNSKKTFQRKFHFILGQDEFSRKESHKHASKEGIRARRWRQINDLDVGLTAPRSDPTASRPDFVVSVLDVKQDHSNEQDTGRSPTKPLGSNYTPSHSEQSFSTRSVSIKPQGPSKISPNSVLGAGRVDPFRTYPIAQTKEIDQLVDHYNFVIPSLLHKHWGRRITRPRPALDLFKLYRLDSASFLGMLHHTAHHLAQLEGRRGDTPQTITYKQMALKILRERISAWSGPYDDGTIVVTGLLANAERIWGDRRTSRMHYVALVWMIRDRGGFPGMTYNPVLHTKLIWSSIALSEASLAEDPAYLDCFPKASSDNNDFPGGYGKSALELCCDDFIDFFSSRKASVLRALPTSQAEKDNIGHSHLRTTCIKPGTRMYSVLTPIETGYSSPDKRRALENCRLACLVYLNIVMMEYGDFSARTERFLSTFSRIVDDDEDDCALSAEHLLWPLLQGIDDFASNERTWTVSRMLAVMKRARQQTWDYIDAVLRLFLVMPEDSSELLTYLSKWDPESFRREVA